MIGGEDDQKVVLSGALEERPEDAPKALVDRGHLAEIRFARVSTLEGLGRQVGVMRIVEMNPCEELSVSLRVEPGLGCSHGLRPEAIGDTKGRLRLDPGGAVVVEIETAIEPESRVQNERAHEGRGAEPEGLE